jgi:hypothetical protein
MIKNFRSLVLSFCLAMILPLSSFAGAGALYAVCTVDSDCGTQMGCSDTGICLYKKGAVCTDDKQCKSGNCSGLSNYKNIGGCKSS